MGFLPTLGESKSHKSWDCIDSWGSQKQLRVEKRNSEGLKKNSSWAHRIAFKAEDLEPFRIVYVEKESEKLRKLLAVAKTEKGIMTCWEMIRSVLTEEESESHALHLLKSDASWKLVYKSLQLAQTEKMSQVSFAHRGASSQPLGRAGTTSAGPAPSECGTDVGDSVSERGAYSPPGGSANKRGASPPPPPPAAATAGGPKQQVTTSNSQAQHETSVSTPEEPPDTPTVAPPTKKKPFKMPPQVGHFMRSIQTKRRDPCLMNTPNYIVVGCTLLLSWWLFQPWIGFFSFLFCVAPFMIHIVVYGVLGTDKVKASKSNNTCVAPEVGATTASAHSPDSLSLQTSTGDILCEQVSGDFQNCSVTSTDAGVIASRGALREAASRGVGEDKADTGDGPRVLPNDDALLENLMFFYNGTGTPIDAKSAKEGFASHPWEPKQAVKDGIAFHFNTRPEVCDKQALKLEMVVPGVSPWTFYEVMNDDKSPDRSDTNAYWHRSDAMADTRKRHRILNPSKAGLVQSSFKTPVWGVAPREFVTALHECAVLTEEQQRKYNLLGETKAPKPNSSNAAAVAPLVIVQVGGLAPPQELLTVKQLPKTQRGNVHYFGWIAQEVEGAQKRTATKLTLIMLVDPCGSIPGAVIKMTHVEQFKKMNHIRNEMTKMGIVPHRGIDMIHGGENLLLNPVGAATTHSPQAQPPSGVLQTEVAPKKSAPSQQQEEEEGPRVMPAVDSEDPVFKAFQLYFASKHWETKSHGDSANIQWSQMETPLGGKASQAKCDKKALLFKTFVPGVSAWTFNATLNDDDSPNRDNKQSTAFKTDTLLLTKNILKRLPPTKPRYGTKMIVQTQYKSPVWGIAPREMQTAVHECVELDAAQKRQLGLQGDGLALLQCAISSDEEHVVPPKKGHQKGEIYGFGFLCQEVEGGVDLHMTLHVDPCGSIPASVVAITNGEQLVKIRRLKDIMEKKGKVQPPQGWIPVGSATPTILVAVKQPAEMPRDESPQAQQPPTRTGDDLLLVDELSTPPPSGYFTSQEGGVPQVETQVFGDQSLQQAEEQQVQNGGPPPPAKAVNKVALPGPVKSYLDLINSDGWEDPPKTNKNTPDITLTTKTVPWAKTKACKLLFKIPPPHASIDIAASLLQDSDFSKTMDKLVDDKVCVRTVNDNLKVMRTTYKSPMWGIAARDMVTYWTPCYFMDDVEERKKYGAPNQDRPDLRVYFTVGEDTAGKEMKEQKGYTRATVHVFGFMVAEESDGSLSCYNCYSSTPGGSMPASLVDATNIAQFDKMNTIREEIVKRSKAANRQG